MAAISCGATRLGGGYAASAALAALWAASPAAAAEFQDGAIDVAIEYTADYIVGIDAPSGDDAFLDNLDVAATFDLERLAGWRGATFFVHLLNNSGETPNDFADTLQGVDNIEVERHRGRLYEAWLELPVGAGSVRAGLYDLNSEFYVNDAAGLLIGPAFGIGSELAATGPNGPSIFPSTALAVRVAAPLGENTTLRAAVLNAEAGVPGDPDGVETSLDGGALVIAEIEWTGATRVGVGGWSYTEEQDDIRAPRRADAFGGYLTLEREVWSGATAFTRVGFSDGDTTPYHGGWQAGVLMEGVFASRPDSQFSIGAYQGCLGDKYRANLRDDGVDPARAETGVELTYSDQLTSWLRLQPDLQVVLDPAGDRDRDNVWLAGLRVAITL